MIPPNYLSAKSKLDEFIEQGLKEYSKIEIKLIKNILKDWRPQKIKKTIESKIHSKKILKAWAQSVQPSDKYKWETKAEDNWLE